MLNANKFFRYRFNINGFLAFIRIETNQPSHTLDAMVTPQVYKYLWGVGGKGQGSSL